MNPEVYNLSHKPHHSGKKSMNLSEEKGFNGTPELNRKTPAKTNIRRRVKMKKQIVMIVTVVSCLTSIVSPALAKDRGGRHGGSGHVFSAAGHGGHSKTGGKNGGNSGDTVLQILGIVRDVVDR